MLNSFDAVQQLLWMFGIVLRPSPEFEEFMMSQKSTKKKPLNDDEVWADEDTKELIEDHDAPGEHYYGEKGRTQPQEPGDLDEETLDPSAPFNKTYGREKQGNTD